ncbi:MAG: hypothetical protein MK135_13430 [Polyangiaceae bacterium]|nr:hypothetical protein [Polyangiaceae bacterium]
MKLPKQPLLPGALLALSTFLVWSCQAPKAPTYPQPPVYEDRVLPPWTPPKSEETIDLEALEGEWVTDGVGGQAGASGR